MPDQPPQKRFADNRELNRALCEAAKGGKKIAFAERLGWRIEAGSVKKLPPERVAEVRRMIGEAAQAGAPDLYEAKVFHVDRKNQNDRIYPDKVMRAQVERLGPLMKEGYLAGAVDHIGEAEGGNLKSSPILWRDLKIDRDGAGMGTFEIIKNHSAGADLQAQVDAGMKIGFSTFGCGSAHEPTKEERVAFNLADDEDAVVMNEGYELNKIDAVDNPAVPDARITGKYPTDTPGANDGKTKGGRVRENNSRSFLVEAKSGIHLTAAELKKALPIAEKKSDRPPLAKTYHRYVGGDDYLDPAGDVKVKETLAADAYRIVSTWTGVRFVRVVPETDELYKFENSVMSEVLKEIDDFWSAATRARYENLGMKHNRAFMLEGPPGNGKTSLVHQIADQVVAAGDVVFYARNISVLAEGLQAFREVEPDRAGTVILEDADEFISYEERQFLQLLDGEQSVPGILYIGTTNYIERFPPRLLRARRFDKRIHVPPPPLAGRLAYLTAKLKDLELAEEISRLATETDGFSFGHLADLIASVYCVQEPKETVLARLKKDAGTSRKRHESTVTRLEQAIAAEAVKQTPDKPTTEKQPMATEATPKPESNKKLVETINKLLAESKSLEGIDLPVREVLPAETAERVEKLEGQVAERDTKLATAAAEKADLQKQIDAFKAKEANAERLTKIREAAVKALKDDKNRPHRFADTITQDIEEAAVAADFTAEKVAALVTAKAEKYAKLAGAEVNGPGKKGTKGKDIDPADLDQADAAEGRQSDEDEDEDLKPSEELAESFGKKKIKPRAAE